MGSLSLEEQRERLKEAISKKEAELIILEEKLDKITPVKPIIYERSDWNYKTHSIDTKNEYYCGYCGESLRKGTKKHKCGSLVDWSGLL